MIHPRPSPERRARCRSIIVGTDGSPTATEAVRRAAALASSDGAVLHLVTAYNPEQRAAERAEAEALPEQLRWMASPGQAAEDVLDETAAALKESDIEGLRVERHARPGEPADVLLDLADELDADLVVVGNKGMLGLKRFVVPSVPNRVSHRATCDVLIVNTTGHE
jgi:nucleotide-binding universal stress UspA family protein